MKSLKDQIKSAKEQLAAAAKWIPRNWFRWIHIVVMAVAGFIGSNTVIAISLIASLVWVGVYILGARNAWKMFRS